MLHRSTLRRALLLGASLYAPAALAQSAPTRQDSTARDSVAKLGGMKVTADRDTRSTLTKLTLPVTASVTAERVAETINLMDTQDAVKYLPSIFVRKRNNGDTQSVMGTRVWGVSSSARSLIFADGVPLTALIANNNTIGGPRWGLVAPETIERVDMMYGPFSAAYAGNSIGAVMEITTRSPEKLEGSITQTQTIMPFDLYATKQSFGTSQTSARVGNRFGKLSVTLSGNYQDSKAQPLTYVTSGTIPAGTTGAFPATNKLNAAANVLGATGLLHTRMLNANGRIAYDITPTIRAAYAYGYWQNDGDAVAEPFIARDGAPTYAGQAGFASGTYGLLQQHNSQSLSLRSDTKGDWDFELIGTRYDISTDRQRFASTASATGTTLGTAGRVALLSGTGWQTADVKVAWHKGGALAAHTVTFGAHVDQYELRNPTFNTTDWRVSEPVTTTLVSRGDGKTRTSALWAQEQWRISPAWRMTVGGRLEQWRAFDGLNVNGATTVNQPQVDLTRFSPKATLAWTGAPDWTVTASLGKAYRFATASELYQLVTTGATFTSPDPNLKPDNVLAAELRAERTFGRGRVQLALFNDEIHDAIISQFKPLVANSNTFYSYVSNVDRVRARGAELVVSERDVLVPGLELTGTATYLNARTLATTGRASATAPADAAIGKRLPNIPDWRANFVATYRPNTRVAMTVGGRYSDALWTTLDNADVNPNVYQGFSGWFVADAHVNLRVQQHLAATLGVDNLLNRKYFLFHPFPQRTFSTSLKVTY
jgi:iron complex outermembrane receptor protein